MARLCCVLFVLLGISTGAQPDQSSGIEGFVKGDMATAIPNATVGVDSLTKGYHRQAVTNASGYYLVSELSPGAYSIWAEVKGVGCITYPRVAVFPGQRLRRDFYFARIKRYPGNCEPLQNTSK